MTTTKTLIAFGALTAAGLMLAGCASTPWPKSRASIEAAPPACADFQVSIYFERDADQVTREARSVLTSAKTMSKGCTVQKARVVGLADSVGASDVNLSLSKRRAQSVTQALAKAGFAQVEIDQMSVGDAGATTNAGAAAPLRRRADIFFDMAPATAPRR
jgi:outer membrane protein OmpA-like peptidoglycan-associated protein